MLFCLRMFSDQLGRESFDFCWVMVWDDLVLAMGAVGFLFTSLLFLHFFLFSFGFFFFCTFSYSLMTSAGPYSLFLYKSP